ncbi:hypothetical protein YC2023_119104 [Brassica napus]
MEKDITLPILAGDCVSGDRKRVRMADPESTVGGEGRPVKLPKTKDNGAYREFLDATDFALVGGDINGDGSFRRHLRGYIAEHPNDEEEVEGIDLHQQRYPWEGSDMDYLYDEVSISLDGLRSIFESRRFEITKLAMCQDSKSISADGKWGCYVGCLVYWAWLNKAQAGNICVAAFDSTCSGICRSADPIVEVNMQCVDL